MRYKGVPTLHWEGANPRESLDGRSWPGTRLMAVVWFSLSRVTVRDTRTNIELRR